MTRTLIAGLLLGAATLQGCSKQVDNDKTPPAGANQSGDKNLADALGKQNGLSNAAEALKNTGLSGIFANAGSYTLIAPNDAAFAKLGDKRQLLAGEANRAALTAAVRDHLVPGYLTREDIAKAIDAAGGKPVKMATLGSGELSFAKAGDAITVTARDGTSGKLAGDAVSAGPSIALPIDTVLKKI